MGKTPEIVNIYTVKTNENRLETGVVQCVNDWPGIFIRGDDAVRLAHTIQTVLDDSLKEESLFTLQLRGWPAILKSCIAEESKTEE